MCDWDAFFNLGFSLTIDFVGVDLQLKEKNWRLRLKYEGKEKNGVSNGIPLSTGYYCSSLF